MIRSAVILAIALAGLWLILSGYFDHKLLLTLGCISIALVIYLCARMKILDDEAVPYVHGKALGYFVWLGKEIVRANMTVVKAVMSPKMEISPSVLKVPMPHETDEGRTVFANSITLTPGTVSVDIEPDGIIVHALLDEMTSQSGFADMAARSAWAVSDPMTTDPNGNRS